MGLTVGIDLGTTNSAIAVLDRHRRPYVVPNGDGDATTPSIVCIRDEEVVVGAEARELQAFDDWMAAAFFKRMMGDEEFGIHSLGGALSATDLSSLVLKKLKSDAEEKLGRSISGAVITVPAYFRNAERKATIEAGRAAGLNVPRIINEPTAAAVAYGADRNRNQGRFVVYDLGGGTFDVTVLDLTSGGTNEIRVRCSSGDDRLGGKDWDDRIIDWLGDQFVGEFGVDPRDDYEALADLRARAEAAKKLLSARLSTVVPIVHDGRRGRYRLTRETVESITGDLVERTISLTMNALEEVGCLRPNRETPDGIDGILLVGGSSRMPAVRRRVEEVFGRPAMGGVNEDEAIALGAAIVAADGTVPEAVDSSSYALPAIFDVTNHSLGMIAENEDGTAYVNSIILPKNREIPCEETREYGLDADRMEIFMTQGEVEEPNHVDYVGKYVVAGIPRRARGDTTVKVKYRYDLNGTVAVSASTKGSSRLLPVTTEDLPSDVPDRFLKPPERAVAEKMTVYMVVDLSGSMCGAPMREAKLAVLGFLGNADLSRCSIGVIAFADRVKTVLKASERESSIRSAIDRLDDAKVGGGTSADPFPEVARRLGRAGGGRFAIVLTDGEWFCNLRAVKRNARDCHRAGIEVIAIGFGDANEEFLREIASSDEAAFYTGMKQLGSTFSTIGQVLTETGGDTGGLSLAIRQATSR